MFLTNERIVLYSFYGLGLLLWFVLWKFFQTIGLVANLPNNLGPISWNSLFAILALGISFGLVQFSLRNQKAQEFGNEVVVETKKVSWPNRKELQGSTLIVVLMTLLVTVIIYIFDKLFDFIFITLIFK